MTTSETSTFHIATGEGNLVLREAGEGPSVLLLHGGLPGTRGWIGGGVLWRPLIAHLAEDYRLLMPDLPATIDPDSRPRDLESCAHSLLALVEQLGIRAVHVVAHDDAALAALRMVRLDGQSGGLVSTVTLVAASTAAPTSEGFDELLLAYPPSLLGLQAQLRWALDRLSRRPGHITDDLVSALARSPSADHLLDELSPIAHEKDLVHQKNLLFSFCRDVGYQIPLNLIWAADDPTTSLDHGYALFDVLAATTPRVSFHVINDVGHFPFREDAAGFARILRAAFS
jgi:2-hydroxy-6-oxonona-2,4-dienedioate hydrolase